MSVNMRWLMITGLAGLLLSGCFLYEEDKPEVVDYGLTLEAVDVVCTEAIFKAGVRIQEAGGREDLRLGLFRDDSLVVTDSLLETGYLRDEGLEPNTAYSYSLAVIDEEGERVQQQNGDSSYVSITTIDTTSHDFDWEIITLGDYGSYFNDVAIVDENNIWAVGLIKTDTATYNAAHWNGSEWEFFSIYDGAMPLYSILCFEDSSIWVTNGCSVFHLENNKWVYYRFSSGGVGVDCCAGSAIWASSPEDIWFAGDKGSLVHYDGSGFHRIQSDTELRLTEIAGDPVTGELWATGFDDVKGSVLLRYIDHQYQTIVRIEEDHSISGSISNVFESLWIHNGVLYIASNGRVYISDYNRTGSILENFWFDYFSSSGYPNRSSDIDGTAANNYFVVGHYGLAQHYNGISWADFSQKLSTVSVNNRVRMKRNTTVICGYTKYFKASVAIGRQN